MGPPRGPSNPWMHELRGYYYCELLLSLGQSETVRERATWVVERNCGNALSAALHRLCLARTYSADEEKAQENAEMAISELRQNGAMDFLPAGLMVRASLRYANDKIREARSDLDEAWEIAERGPMKLHMADILLHRARLFFREAQYPWGSPAADLAAARKLIEQCGYGRRKEELEDAESALTG